MRIDCKNQKIIFKKSSKKFSSLLSIKLLYNKVSLTFPIYKILFKEKQQQQQQQKEENKNYQLFRTVIFN